MEHTSGKREGQRMFLLYICVCVDVCEELTVTAGWWLGPTNAGRSALAVNALSHIHTIVKVELL